MQASHRPALLVALLIFFVLFTGGCAKTLAPSHPNQINNLDGALFDSLIAIQASLAQATTIVTTDPAMAKYKDAVNQARAAYSVAQAAYKVYHDAGAPSGQAAALQSEVSDVVAQVSKLLSTLGVKL